MKPLFLSLIILFVLVSGCSTLRTSVRSDVDWSTYSSVEVSVPEPDRWDMRPLVIERLADWGFVPVAGNQQHSDLLATLEVTEGFSLAENGDITTWPKNLLLQLHDRSNGAELAYSRYQLAPTQNPKHGLNLMINDLRKQASKTTGPTPAPHPLEDKNTTTSPLSLPQPPPDETKAEPAAASSLRKSGPATAAAPDPTQPPLDGFNELERAPSDWIPRFKGWQPWER